MFPGSFPNPPPQHRDRSSVEVYHIINYYIPPAHPLPWPVFQGLSFPVSVRPPAYSKQQRKAYGTSKSKQRSCSRSRAFTLGAVAGRRAVSASVSVAGVGVFVHVTSDGGGCLLVGCVTRWSPLQVQ